MFGGINIIFAGDFWQLPPVLALAIFSNPFLKGHSAEEQKIFYMFWKQNDPDSIQRTFLLTESMRTKDQWLQTVLKSDRYGEESWEIYCFTHGFPTRNPGTWLPDSDTPWCGNPVCATLSTQWDNMFRECLKANKKISGSIVGKWSAKYVVVNAPVVVA